MLLPPPPSACHAARTESGLQPSSIRAAPRQQQDIDKNQDGRISEDEFVRAFSAGGVPGIPGAGMLGNPDQMQRMKDAGELDDFTVRESPKP